MGKGKRIIVIGVRKYVLEKYLIKKTGVLLIMPMAVCRGQLLSEPWV
jgi:hypothetical protein